MARADNTGIKFIIADEIHDNRHDDQHFRDFIYNLITQSKVYKGLGVQFPKSVEDFFMQSILQIKDKSEETHKFNAQQHIESISNDPRNTGGVLKSITVNKKDLATFSAWLHINTPEVNNWVVDFFKMNEKQTFCHGNVGIIHDMFREFDKWSTIPSSRDTCIKRDQVCTTSHNKCSSSIRNQLELVLLQADSTELIYLEEVSIDMRNTGYILYKPKEHKFKNKYNDMYGNNGHNIINLSLILEKEGIQKGLSLFHTVINNVYNVINHKQSKHKGVTSGGGNISTKRKIQDVVIDEFNTTNALFTELFGITFEINYSSDTDLCNTYILTCLEFKYLMDRLQIKSAYFHNAGLAGGDKLMCLAGAYLYGLPTIYSSPGKKIRDDANDANDQDATTEDTEVKLIFYNFKQVDVQHKIDGLRSAFREQLAKLSHVMELIAHIQATHNKHPIHANIDNIDTIKLEYTSYIIGYYPFEYCIIGIALYICNYVHALQMFVHNIITMSSQTIAHVHAKISHYDEKLDGLNKENIDTYFLEYQKLLNYIETLSETLPIRAQDLNNIKKLINGANNNSITDVLSMYGNKAKILQELLVHHFTIKSSMQPATIMSGTTHSFFNIFEHIRNNFGDFLSHEEHEFVKAYYTKNKKDTAIGILNFTMRCGIAKVKHGSKDETYDLCCSYNHYGIIKSALASLQPKLDHMPHVKPLQNISHIRGVSGGVSGVLPQTIQPRHTRKTHIQPAPFMTQQDKEANVSQAALKAAKVKEGVSAQLGKLKKGGPLGMTLPAPIAQSARNPNIPPTPRASASLNEMNLVKVMMVQIYLLNGIYKKRADYILGEMDARHRNRSTFAKMFHDKQPEACIKHMLSLLR